MIGRSCSPTPTPWPNCRPKASISSTNPNSSARGHTFAIWSVVAPGRTRSIAASIHSRDRLKASRCAWRRPAHHERAVVAGPVAVEDVDDVEVGLVARPDQPVAEHVRMRAAAFAGDRVDRLDELRAHPEQAGVRHADDVGLAHPGLQHLEDVLIDAVDHGARLGQQHDLVGALDLAGVHHRLLAVDTRSPAAWSARNTEVSARSTPSCSSATPSSSRARLDLAHGARVQPGLRPDRALQPGVAADRVLARRTGAAAAAGAPSPPSRSPRSGAARSRVISAQRSPLLNAQ